MAVGCELAVPVFLKQILLFLTPAGAPGRGELFLDSGIGLAICIFLLQAGLSVFQRTAEQLVREVIMNVRTIIIGSVYEKSLRLSGEASREFTNGSVMNMINVDSETIMVAIFFMNFLVGSPFQVIIAIGLLFQNLGVLPVLASIAVMVVLVAIQAPFMVYAKRSRVTILSAGDVRVAGVREILYGIKIIKLRAWEEFFVDKVAKLRQKQLTALKGSYVAFGGFITLAQLTPIMMPIAAFIVYSAKNGGVDATVVFPAIVLFNILIAPMLDLPQGLSFIIAATVSWKRINKLLQASESKPLQITPVTSGSTTKGPGDDIVISDATYKWEVVLATEKDKDKKETKKEKKERKRSASSSKAKSEANSSPPDSSSAEGSAETLVEEKKEIEPLFRNLNLTFQKGALTAVVGAVGSGKSSLLGAIIGEMTQLSGKTSIHGSIAYSAQQPWIQTGSVKDNIVFQHAYDERRLSEAVRVCGLESDVRQLSAGMDTEIGEKGVNLSGGQKARVALARAVYEDCDIYLLDDPISALDAQVGAKVYSECIKGSLAGKTRVLVTHHLHLLQDVDRIVVLEDGAVAEEGTFQTLLAKNGLFTELMKDYHLDDPEQEEEEKDQVEKAQAAKSDEREKPNDAGGLIAEEERVQGAVQWPTYKAYIIGAGGVTYVFAVVSMSAIAQGVTIMSQYWLSWWSERKLDIGDSSYLLGYAMLGIGIAVTTTLVNVALFFGNYAVAKSIHHRAFKQLLRSPMGFFDTQPIGRLLNRFTKDIDSVDQRLWGDILTMCISVSQIVGAIVLLAIVSPYMLIAFVPVVTLYFYVLQYYRATFRELKRLDSVLRSPLYAQVSESLTGISTIRAYKAEDRFIQRQRALIDVSNSPYYLMFSATVWIGIRIELVSCLIVFALAMLGVEGVIAAPLVGLAFTYAVPLTQFINMLLRSFASLESDMNSIERLEEYAVDIAEEAPAYQANDPAPGVWPTAGAIDISHLELRYPSRPDHAVIQDLSLSVKPGEKVGIVGRTGSGKSTLLTALFRMVEPSQGSITIDGQDISKLGLCTLRRAVDIIPQDPTLFTGTIRNNLDVESQHSDAEIWELLDRINLKTYVTSLPEKLDAPVAEQGENLSVGQRQLICLGRAMLKKPAILVMDEATAAIDGAADERIQSLIRSQFSTSTILCIAHRLNTIADFDRVLVMDAGRKAEFDTPHKLFQNPHSLFSQLADATGVANSQLLRQVAAEHDRQTTLEKEQRAAN
ncbi:P-loop containing nucleoside triphosphate hydrolase protein [Powellomyces hirtus]|nr:P-loop containing nucleoside triphosphate hydrolase protein [Powellomyces hirtus]